MKRQGQDDLETRIGVYAFIVAYFVIALIMVSSGARFLTSIVTAAAIPAVGLFTYIVWSSRPTSEERQFQSEWNKRLFPTSADIAMNNGPGTFQYEVVGESHYAENLKAIIEEANLTATEPGELYCQAFLFCEPKNPYDSNAVAVVIGRKTVGYIPRRDAQKLAPELRRLANTRAAGGRGGQILCVQACVGWSSPERIGVRLDLDEF